MNPQNVVELDGHIHADRRAGACWTRWKPGGRGQVRFWLAVSRELLGEGFDLFLCAIEPKTALEVGRLEEQLTDGRHVHLVCSARRLEIYGKPFDEDSVCVIFVAETAGIDGREVADVHRIGVHHNRARGKMAAANDQDGAQAELLELSASR